MSELKSSLPRAQYRVDPGPLPESWPRWKDGFQVAKSYRSKGHALNRLRDLRKMGFPSPTIHMSVLTFTDITDQHPADS